MATLKEIAAAIKKVGLDKNEMAVKSVPAVAAELDEELTGSFVREVYDAEPVAFPALKVDPTQKGVTAARKQGLRFERIAARSGLSVGDVRDFAEKGGVGADFYVGRGRRSGENGGSAEPKSKAQSGRRGKAAASKDEQPKAGTSGRRGRKTEQAQPEPKARGRRGTRAAANPK